MTAASDRRSNLFRWQKLPWLASHHCTQDNIQRIAQYPSDLCGEPFIGDRTGERCAALKDLSRFVKAGLRLLWERNSHGQESCFTVFEYLVPLMSPNSET